MMLKVKKFGGKTFQKYRDAADEDLYDDDFEDFDYGTGLQSDVEMGHDCQSQFADFCLLQNVLVTPSASLTSAVSVTPDSAGNNSNTRGTNFVDYELLDSLESDFTYEDEEETAASQNFDFSSFQDVLEDIPASKQKRFKNGTRSSLTFSNQKMRDIERENQILLAKIMKRGPSRDIDNPKAPGSAVSLKFIQIFRFC